MKHHLKLLLLLTSFALFAACGSTRALKHTVPDRELAGLTGDTATRLDAARGDLQRAEDELRQFDGQRQDGDKQLESVERQQDAAEEAIEAAEDRIEATRDAEGQELAKARATRDAAIAAARKAYEQEERTIREKFGAQQKDNRVVLADAEGQKALADLERQYQQALIKRHEAEKAVREQAIWVRRAELEQQKYDAWLGLKAVQTEQDAKRKLAFEKQVLEEKTTATKLQEQLLKRDGEVQALRSKVEQERARQNTAP
jgi:hypothetical protein